MTGVNKVSKTIKLLIVEDSELVSGRIVALLGQNASFAILVAATLAEAIARMAHEPVLMSVDLHLPDGSGLDAIKHAQTMRRRPLIYVLTAMPEMKQVCLQAGADLVFDKHEDMPAYLTAVRNKMDSLATTWAQNFLEDEDTT